MKIENREVESFNSTLVQLKVGLFSFEPVQIEKFQFYLSSIKRRNDHS